MEELIERFIHRNILDEYFDKIFIINLDSRLDKWIHMERVMEKNNIKNYERFSGIVPTDEDIIKYGFDLSPNFDMSYDKETYNRGSLGCLLSHVSVVRIAKERGYKNVVILEDDMYFVEDWERKLKDTMIELEKVEWDMFYLYFSPIMPQIYSGKFNDILNRSIRIISAAAYVVNESIYDIILDNAINYKREIDVFYMDYIQINYECYQSKYKILEWLSNIPSNITVRKPKIEDNKKISIVMTSYNRKEQTDYTLKTIEMSEYKNKEIIIIDDGSDEKLDDIVKKYDMDIKLFRIEDNEFINPCIAYNIGFKYATGDVVIIQNAECCHIGDICSYVGKNISENNYLSFTCVNMGLQEYNEQLYKVYNKLDDISGVKNYVKELEGIYREGNKSYLFWYNHEIYRPESYHFLTAITKSDLNKVGGFDERYAFGSAYDDDALVEVIKKKNINIKFVGMEDVFVIHQWHKRTENMMQYENMNKNRLIFNEHMKEIGSERFIDRVY